nr:MAG TPA: hypothetical protein [Caudoviricetes sp.]
MYRVFDKPFYKNIYGLSVFVLILFFFVFYPFFKDFFLF